MFKLGCGLFADECRKLAKEYPDVVYDEVLVETFAMKLVMNLSSSTDRPRPTRSATSFPICRGLVADWGSPQGYRPTAARDGAGDARLAPTSREGMPIRTRCHVRPDV